MMVVRAFNRQDYEKDRFEKVNKDLTDTNLFVNRVMTFMMPVMTLIMADAVFGSVAKCKVTGFPSI